MPTDAAIMESLVFDTRFHDVDALVGSVPESILQFDQLNGFAARLQNSITASPTLRSYVLNLWRATKAPLDFGVQEMCIRDRSKLMVASATPITNLRIITRFKSMV